MLNRLVFLKIDTAGRVVIDMRKHYLEVEDVSFFIIIYKHKRCFKRVFRSTWKSMADLL